MSILQISVITDDADLATLSEDWHALLEETDGSSGFQSLAWISACRSGLPSDASLFVLVFRDGRDVVAIMPTELGPGGALRLIGQGPLSNYLGPVCRASHVDAVVQAFGAFLARERRVSLLDFRGLREHSPFLALLRRGEIAGWSRTRVVQTAVCPYIDLSPGWEAVYARRKGKQRGNIARKWKALERLGRPEFEEVADPARVEATLPVMFELFRGRWSGRHESGGFAERHRAFHTQAAVALATAGHLRLSLLRLDGQVVAFAYGVRARGVTVSYVLAHDDALGVCSPGLLLLVRALETACRRGDVEYDFSIGEEEYKDTWATGTRAVFRALSWRRGSLAALHGRLGSLGTRAWVGARSVGWLRDLRREGLRQLVGGTSHDELPDTPGLPAGAGRSWQVQRLERSTGDSGVVARRWPYPELAQRLSPRLLELAVDRSFRGDTLLPLFSGDRLLGVTWRAEPGRRAVITDGAALQDDDVVFYHPVAAPGSTLTQMMTALADLAAPQSAVVVVCEPHPPGAPAQHLGTFVADHRFRRATPPAQRLPGSR
jgi:CelD/BcsL family acetyltransferase involved in cellulose biosynthesis